MSNLYKFPNGKWSIEDYRPAVGDSFTGTFRLKVDGVPGNPTHSQAIIVHCDDAEFIGELLTFLNRNQPTE